MTSSLVGSEMCIRDSRVGALGACPVRSLPWRRIFASKNLHTGVHGAVSYTHLTLPTICSV
eukprot:11526896-Prorocentrum_lima.AAC.1